ncbi:DUF4365 domain-containing protein [Janthinobacterium sp. PAMC25594]|uniref:DUF4365 domain-containing protein n=1 Tax=Janthinobacterium sp. PAMC25594 TaxID=2861284 RepID=UPI001C62ED2D|nr:DUF4365 domain-containing protein [Janthinobacterium sp. PAMC25594]
MSPLSDQNVESELSYAYLHAVAAHAGASCSSSGRHMDNAGVDATITGWGPFPDGGYRQEVSINIQLKATIKVPAEVGSSFSYSLDGISRYDDLRTDAMALPRILVVLFLPKTRDKWITHADDALSLHKCAYWVSLRGAQPSTNATSQVVYLPKSQRFDVAGLSVLMAAISRNDVPTYKGEPA